MGIATRRFIPRMPDLVDADVDDILRMVNPLLQSLLNPNSLPASPLRLFKKRVKCRPTRQREIPHRKRTQVVARDMLLPRDFELVRQRHCGHDASVADDVGAGEISGLIAGTER